MADFLGNLLLRNGIPHGARTPAAILQARLPSLFEATYDTHQLSALKINSTISANLPHSELEPTLADSEGESPAGNFTIWVDPEEHQPDTFPSMQKGSALLRQEKFSPTLSPPGEGARPAKPDTPRPTKRVQRRQFISAQNETSPTAPHRLDGKSIEDVRSAKGENRLSFGAVPLKGESNVNRGSKPVTDGKPPFFATVKMAEVPSDQPRLIPRQIEKSPLPLQTDNDVQPPEGEHLLDTPPKIHSRSFPDGAEGMPRTVIHPSVVPFYAETTRQVKHLVEHEQPRVVEIHIGRIEVRAVPPAPAPKRNAPAPVMSLDEYLQRRRGGGR